MKPTGNPERWGGFKPINCLSGDVVIFWSNTTDKSQKYRAVH